MPNTSILLPHDPYADLGDDADGLPDGVASDICPLCGPVRLTTRDGRVVATRDDGMGLCLCTPTERLAAEAAQNRRRRQSVDDRARRARKSACAANDTIDATATPDSRSAARLTSSGTM